MFSKMFHGVSIDFMRWVQTLFKLCEITSCVCKLDDIFLMELLQIQCLLVMLADPMS